jgi:UDP-N-acetylmuramoyl-tripeptide--D-alanyl-D-alanine ligase
MRNFFKNIVLFLLKRFEKRRVKKFKGKVIGVTGSVGKTSTKEAIYTVLNTKFKVLKSEGSMNTEFGLPLTILELKSGYGNAFKWSYLLIKGFFMSFKKMYAEVLVVEMGVDKPKDMDFLLSIVKPDIAVMGPIAHVHLAEGQFKNLDEIFEEKSKIVKTLGDNGIAVLFADDDRTMELKKGRPKSKTFTYGTVPDADYKATGVEESVEGVKFNLNMDNRRVEILLPILGKHHVNVILPAIVCGLAMGLNIEEVLEALKRFKLPPGRMNLIEGREEGVMIIDSSYNSSPKACAEALRTLSELKVRSGGRKIAVLGSMNELGEETERLHKEIAARIPDCCDILVTVGEAAETFAKEVEAAGMKNIFKFKNVFEAIEGFKSEIRKNDLILVKGSQNNVRLEKFVKEVMKFPEEAEKLLARQGKDWKKI